MGKYAARKKTMEELEQEWKDLEEQEKLFGFEQELKKKQILFREKVLDQLAEDVTLDDVLNNMESLCEFISVWARKNRTD